MQSSEKCCRAVQLTKASVRSTVNVRRRCLTRARLACMRSVQSDSSNLSAPYMTQSRPQHRMLITRKVIVTVSANSSSDVNSAKKHETTQNC